MANWKLTKGKVILGLVVSFVLSYFLFNWSLCMGAGFCVISINEFLKATSMGFGNWFFVPFVVLFLIFYLIYSLLQKR